MARPCPPLGRAPELCQLCGWALWLGLVLLLSQALSSSCPPLVLLARRALSPGLALLLSFSRRQRQRQTETETETETDTDRDREREREKERKKERKEERKKERQRERESERASKQASKQAREGGRKEGRKEGKKKEIDKERKTAGRARACVLWTGALTLQKGAVRARCAKRKTEKETLRERERAERRRACSCAMDGLLGSCLLLVLCAGLCGWALSSSCPPLVLVLAAPLNSVAGLCGPALCPGLVLLLSLSWPRP